MVAKRDAKYGHVKSVVAQYVGGRTRAKDVFTGTTASISTNANATKLEKNSFDGPTNPPHSMATRRLPDAANVRGGFRHRSGSNGRDYRHRHRHSTNVTDATDATTATAASTTAANATDGDARTPPSYAAACVGDQYDDVATDACSDATFTPPYPLSRLANALRTVRANGAAVTATASPLSSPPPPSRLPPPPPPSSSSAFVEECDRDLLCVNFSDAAAAAAAATTLTSRRRKSASLATAKDDDDDDDDDLPSQRSRLSGELHRLKRVSSDNEQRIGRLFRRLNSLKLSLTLLREEEQRLEHSKQIRGVNTRLLLGMLRTRLRRDEREQRQNEARLETEARIVRGLFDKFATLEELKMRLEYENTRNLYAIKELKRDNAKLEQKRRELARRIDILDSV